MWSSKPFAISRSALPYDCQIELPRLSTFAEYTCCARLLLLENREALFRRELCFDRHHFARSISGDHRDRRICHEWHAGLLPSEANRAPRQAVLDLEISDHDDWSTNSTDSP